MKIAIIGASLNACELAYEMAILEAEVTIFTPNKLGQQFLFLDSLLNDKEILDCEHFCKLDSKLRDLVKVKNVQISRVQKRYLHSNEKIESRSRLYDLFRVVFCDENSEHKEIEQFEDFDIVIEAEELESGRGGSGGIPALNEENLNTEDGYFRGFPELIKLDLRKCKKLAIIGDGVYSASFLMSLVNWLDANRDNELYIITDKLTPYHSIKDFSLALDKKLDLVMEREKNKFEKQVFEYEEEVFKYRNLEKQDKIKLKSPVEPSPRMKVLSKYTVTAIDKLTDREGLFLTLELPEWRDDQGLGLTTINVDHVVTLNGTQAKRPYGIGLIEDEPGYFNISDHDENIEPNLKTVNDVKNKILSYFTRVE